jgi:CDP-diacylglycerol---glycerol-3-phosphate 3-phosphatidyltransferase
MARIFGGFKTGVRVAFDPVGRLLVRAGVSPDAVTIAGTAGIVAAAVIFAGRGQLVPATLIITAFGLLDVVDGSMARARGYSSRYGALLDSTMDRVADGAIFGSLAWWLATTDRPVSAAVALVCLVGGQIVSYVKARAEGLGFTCDVGFAERMERLILVGVGGLLTGFGLSWGLPVVLWILAVATLATVVQRVLHVRAQERAGVPEPNPEPTT